jgi:hypothetical protein
MGDEIVIENWCDFEVNHFVALCAYQANVTLSCFAAAVSRKIIG